MRLALKMLSILGVGALIYNVFSKEKETAAEAKKTNEEYLRYLKILNDLGLKESKELAILYNYLLNNYTDLLHENKFEEVVNAVLNNSIDGDDSRIINVVLYIQDNVPNFTVQVKETVTGDTLNNTSDTKSDTSVTKSDTSDTGVKKPVVSQERTQSDTPNVTSDTKVVTDDTADVTKLVTDDTLRGKVECKHCQTVMHLDMSEKKFCPHMKMNAKSNRIIYKSAKELKLLNKK